MSEICLTYMKWYMLEICLSKGVSYAYRYNFWYSQEISEIGLCLTALSCYNNAGPGAGCPAGYSSKAGDIPGWGQIRGGIRTSMQGCGEECRKQEGCCSFEFSYTWGLCNLNRDCKPSQGKYWDFHFCISRPGSWVSIVRESLHQAALTKRRIFSQSVSLTQYVVCLSVRLFQLASESPCDIVAGRRSDYCPLGAIFS